MKIPDKKHRVPDRAKSAAKEPVKNGATDNVAGAPKRDDVSAYAGTTSRSKAERPAAPVAGGAGAVQVRFGMEAPGRADETPPPHASFGHGMKKKLRNLALGLMIGATTLGVVGCGNNVATGPELGGKPAVVEQVAPTPARTLQLPQQYEVKERVLSWSTTLDVQAGGKSYGRLDEKILSLTRSFTFRDASGALVADAHAKAFSWGTQIDVKDGGGAPIGSVKENVLKSLLKVSSEYEIKDGSGKLIATSKKSDWLATDFEINAPDGHLIAKMHRPAINLLSDTWTVEVKDKTAMDARLMAIIAAYKTSTDNERRAELEKNS